MVETEIVPSSVPSCCKDIIVPSLVVRLKVPTVPALLVKSEPPAASTFKTPELYVFKVKLEEPKVSPASIESGAELLRYDAVGLVKLMS